MAGGEGESAVAGRAEGFDGGGFWKGRLCRGGCSLAGDFGLAGG